MFKPLTALVATLALASCGDPLAKVERISDVQLATDEAVASALPSAEETSQDGGFLSRLLSSVDQDNAEVATAGVSLPATGAEPVPVSQTETAAMAEPVQIVPSVPAAAPKSRGLFARLRGAASPDDQDTQTVSLSGDIAPPDAERPVGATDPAGRVGLFGPRKAQTRSGPDAGDVKFGTILPYGMVARVCEAKRSSLGRRLDKAPTRGRGYALYDSAPNSTAPRTFYVTGFTDGCPRQFTAALALFGAPTMHEQLRYGRPSDKYPYSTTDKAYEKIKSSVCGVSRRKPCGSAIGKLEKNTVFISTYERFEDNARWADILLHDGAVVAAALKTP